MAAQASNVQLSPYLESLREIITTEKTYVTSLFKLGSKYLNPLADRCILSCADHSCIFINFLDLMKLHYTFLIALYEAVDSNFAKGCSKWPKPQASSCLVKTFLAFKDRFIQHYSFYISNVEAARAKLQQLTQSDQIFQAKLLECESDDDSLPVLKDMLICPMQRITRYHLLLNELVKRATNQCEEAENLRKLVLAQKAMHDILLHLNEVKRDTEIIQKFKKISFTPLASPTHRFAMQCATGAVVPFEVNDYGKLLDDCTVRFSWNCEHKLEPAHLFLFQNVVVICDRECNGVYNFRHACHLHDYKAEDWTKMVAETDRDSCNLCVPLNSELVEKRDRLFWLINAENSIIICCCKGNLLGNSRNDWIDRVNKARDNFLLEQARKMTNHTFGVQTFNRPTDCYVCGELLKGLICQGYKCSQCKRAVHKTCADNLYDCVQMRSHDFQDLKSFHERKSRQSHSTSYKWAINNGEAIDTAFTYPEVVAVKPSKTIVSQNTPKKQ